MKYQILDNFLPQEDFINLHDEIMGDNFPWYFLNVINNVSDPSEIQDLKAFQFVHLFFKYSNNSNYFDLLQPLLNRLDYSALTSAKANLTTFTHQSIEFGKHVDFDNYLGLSSIFYINKNNGVTVLEGVEVESVPNRLVVFNSEIVHFGTTPTDCKRRVLINLNFIPFKNGNFNHLL